MKTACELIERIDALPPAKRAEALDLALDVYRFSQHPEAINIVSRLKERWSSRWSYLYMRAG